MLIKYWDHRYSMGHMALFSLGRRFTQIYAENYFLKVSNNLIRLLNHKNI